MIVFLCLEEDGGRPPMDSSRRRTSGALENSSAAVRAPMVSNTALFSYFFFSRRVKKLIDFFFLYCWQMPSSSLFGQSAGSSRRVTSEELQRSRTGSGLRNSGMVSTSERKRSSSTRKQYDSAIKGIETLHVSDERYHHHWSIG